MGWWNIFGARRVEERAIKRYFYTPNYFGFRIKIVFNSQVCRNGMVQHLEHLLFYGADMNARNASGNTPLHVCAVNNQVQI